MKEINDKISLTHRPIRFLRWFCPAHLYEEIEGDLIQKFEKDVRTVGEKKAKRGLIWNVTKVSDTLKVSDT